MFEIVLHITTSPLTWLAIWFLAIFMTIFLLRDIINDNEDAPYCFWFAAPLLWALIIVFYFKH